MLLVSEAGRGPVGGKGCPRSSHVTCAR